MDQTGQQPPPCPTRRARHQVRLVDHGGRGPALLAGPGAAGPGLARPGPGWTPPPCLPNSRRDNATPHASSVATRPACRHPHTGDRPWSKGPTSRSRRAPGRAR